MQEYGSQFHSNHAVKRKKKTHIPLSSVSQIFSLMCNIHFDKAAT